MSRPGPRWKRQQWTVARAAALLSALVSSKNGESIDLADIKKRFGIGLREMVNLNRRLISNEDLSGSTQVNLELQFEEGKVRAIGADRLSRLTRLSRVQAAFAAQALENLSAQGATKEFSLKLAKRLHTAAGKVDDQLLIYRPSDSSPLRAKIALLDDAIRRQMTVAFEYRGPSSRSAGRVVDPLSLRRDQNVWRVLAWDHHREGLRTFRLDQMTKLVVTVTRFEWNPGLKPDFVKAQDLSVYNPTGKEFAVKMKVSARVAKDWSAVFKKIGKLDKTGYCETTLMTASPEWLIRTFLPLVDETRVLGPEVVVSRWRQEIMAMSERNLGGK